MTVSQRKMDTTLADSQAEEEAILAEMADLAEEAGDWREHLPYGAAVAYFQDPDVQGQYATHVSECSYCRKMIDSLNPSNRILGQLHYVVTEEYGSRYLDEEFSAFPAGQPEHSGNALRIGSGLLIAATIAAVSIIGLQTFSGDDAGGRIDESATADVGAWIDDDTNALAADDRYFHLTDPGIEFSSELADKLIRLESSGNYADQFMAARIYLEADQGVLAYDRVGTGLGLAGIDKNLVDAVNLAKLDIRNAIALRAATVRLQEIESTDERSSDVLLEYIRLNAQLGRHDSALVSISEYLETATSEVPVKDAFDAVVVTYITEEGNQSKNTND